MPKGSDLTLRSLRALRETDLWYRFDKARDPSLVLLLIVNKHRHSFFRFDLRHFLLTYFKDLFLSNLRRFFSALPEFPVYERLDGHGYDGSA